MKVKTKMGFGFKGGKTITHRISVDENSLTCAAIFASAAVAGKVADVIGKVAIEFVDGYNDRKQEKLEWKLHHPSNK